MKKCLFTNEKLRLRLDLLYSIDLFVNKLETKFNNLFEGFVFCANEKQEPFICCFFILRNDE